jgi:hypothetical protein
MSASMPDDRLGRQVAFLIEADKLKTILRRTSLVDSSRRENSAEHSWHLALAAMVVREYTCVELDLGRALEIVTVHDLVEIDAGDRSSLPCRGCGPWSWRSSTRSVLRGLFAREGEGKLTMENAGSVTAGAREGREAN